MIFHYLLPENQHLQTNAGRGGGFLRNVYFVISKLFRINYEKRTKLLAKR